MLKKKDFIEIEFTGKTKEGEIFDSNIKEDLKSVNQKIEPKPFVFCLGEGMFLEGVEDYLIGKDIGKYHIELSPEKAFGKRNPKFIQLMPTKVFKEHQINPAPGAMFNFDGKIGKIISVSGGRIIVDFNNPLAGKEVVYEIKVLRKVDDKNEQIKAFINFLFKKDFEFKVEGKKLIIKTDKGFKQFAELFKDKFKDLFNLEFDIKEIGEKIEKKNEKE
jgi:FKBP-type peptidyl-prolyl cis-trans isomerase 2